MSGRQHSVVKHLTNYFYIPQEDDYLLLYERQNEERNKAGKKSGSSDCKAMIAAVIESWMNSKRATAKGTDDLYVYLTHDEMVSELRGRFKRNTVMQCLKEMEEDGTYTDDKGQIYTGTIIKKPHVQNTFKYLLNLPVIHFLFSQLPEQTPYGIYNRPKVSLGRPQKNCPKINSLNLNCLNRDGIQENSPKKDGITEKYCPKINFSTITQNPYYTELSNTQRERDSRATNAQSTSIVSDAIASTDDSLSSSFSSNSNDDKQAALLSLVREWRNSNEDEQHQTLQTLVEAGILPPSVLSASPMSHPVSYGSGQQPYDTPTPCEDIAPIVETPIATPPETPATSELAGKVIAPLTSATRQESHSSAIPTDTPSQSTTQQRTQDVHRATDEIPQASYSHEETTCINGVLPDMPVPAQPESPKGTRRAKKGDVKPVELPMMPPDDAPWCTTTCLQMFTVWRGAPLLAKYQMQKASQAAKGLADNYTRKQVTEVYEYMSKQDYWIAQGGVDITNVANNIVRELRKMETEAQQSAKRTANKNTQQKVSPTSNAATSSVLVSEEKRQRNIARLMANAAAATEAKTLAAVTK